MGDVRKDIMACGLGGLHKGRSEKKDRQRRSTGDVRKDIFLLVSRTKSTH